MIHFSKNPTEIHFGFRIGDFGLRRGARIVRPLRQSEIHNPKPAINLVEPMGLEPTTSWLQTRRSPS
jgi:hypothetical protein